MESKRAAYVLITLMLLSQQTVLVSTQSIAGLVGPVLGDPKAFAGILDFLIKSQLETINNLEILAKTVNYSLPLIEYDSKGMFLQGVLPWAFGKLPDLVGNPLFQDAAKFFLEEVNAYKDLFRQPGYLTVDHKPNFDKYMTSLIPLMFSDIFSLNSTTRPLDGQCYSDVMTFIFKLLAADKAAVQMFDAVGKPTTGINQGVLYFMGSYDECLAVHAKSDDSNMNATTPGGSSDSYDFRGRYCRATFDPPRSLVESIAGEHINETHGIPLTLSWGMCLPDSCSEGDIEGLLNLGLLGKFFNVTVKEAHCSRDQGFEDDKQVHIVLGILGSLLGIVIICSVLDLIFFKPKSSKTDSASNKYAVHNVPMYDNMSFDKDKPNDTTDQVEMSHRGDDVGKDKDGDKDTTLESNGHFTTGKLEFMDVTMDSDITADREVEQQGRAVRLIRAFSVFTNIPTLMDDEAKEGDIPCIYGIRVVSMAFIVLANTFLYSVLSLAEVPVSVNLMDSFDFLDRWTFQPILQASLNTDTFFLISGCLTSYWFLVRSKSLGRKPNGWVWLKFYVGRYWKMTPPYMLVLVLFVYLYMYLGQGPMWPDRMNVAEKCKTDWWKHLIYISNLVGVDGVAAEDQCMPWSWYLAVNMQFYLIAPLFLSLLVYSSSMGVILLAIISTAGIIASGVKESEFGGDLQTTRTDNGAYWNNIFIKPWCRIAPFAIGMMLGFLIHRRRTVGKRMKTWLAAICWVATLCPAVLVLYCQYTKYVDSITPWDRAQDSAFEALSRPVWAIAVGWIIYASCEGFAGPIGEFFSWRGFIPLSRMTFVVYLLHPIVIVLFTYSKRTLIHLNDFAMIYLYLGHLVLSYAGAFLACLVFDLPFRNIRRVIQGKPVDTPY